jgi:hypothetical protein
MAARFWVGGTGNWDATTTTNWSATSGGSGGASVPTLADDVTFDSASNATAYVVTLTATATCGAFSLAGPASGNVTFAGSSTWNVYGNFLIAATGVTYTCTSTVNFNGSGTSQSFTITTNGSALAGVNIGNTLLGNNTWTLGSAITVTGNLLVRSNSIFTTNNFAITAEIFGFSGSAGNGVANLGSSVIVLSSSSPFFISTQGVGFVFNAGTSQITCNAFNPTIDFTSFNFYNVNLSSTTSTNTTFTSTNTYNNLTIAGLASSGVNVVDINTNLQVNGTFTISAGANATCRTSIDAVRQTIAITITAAAVSLTDVDFLNITGAGTATWAGTRLGNGAGNTNIAFDAGVNKYWNLAVGGNYSSTGWATTSGGTPSVNNFPLAQDVSIFESTGLNSGATVTMNANWTVGTIDMSARTSNLMTLEFASSYINCTKNWVNGTGTTLTSSVTSQILFLNRTSGTITSAGKSFPCGIKISCLTGTYALNDACTSTLSNSTLRSFNLDSGTINLNGFTLTGIYNGTSVKFVTKNITFNGGTIICTGVISAWNSTSFSPYFTTTTGTGIGVISLTSTSAKRFIANDNIVYNCTINQGGSGSLTFIGSSTYNNITNTVQPASILFTSGSTFTFENFNLNGSIGNLITVGSTSTGTHTLSKSSGAVNGSYLTISKSIATGGATWIAKNSVDGGSNTGWKFISPAFFFMFS